MVSANIDTRRLKIAMRRTPILLAQGMSVAFDRHGFIFEGHARSTLFGGGTGLTGRTGKTARSIGHTKPRKASKISDVRMRVFVGGPTAPGARIQEFGGPVSAKPGKYLTIPLSDNRTAGGVPRYKSARALFENQPKNTFIAKTKRGKLLIGLKSSQTVKWLWVLKESVRLKPRFGFRKAFRSPAMQRDRTERINRAIAQALRGGS